MRDEEIEHFRSNVRRTLCQIFLGKNIESPAAYFSIWHEFRKVLEEELSRIVNGDTLVEIDKIKTV